ncbi:Protein of unknown function [Pyronema omphalodes CBS 100304]|uniref:Uncharacterized protein n=1 Tax=Pyronema omphalodes (strain CBS 100304) TaxID=1076935 RepID=U4L1A2_PYROM|nr:Protein of unknown function [Pyronema omphalodes CBS 100304]
MRSSQRNLEKDLGYRDILKIQTPTNARRSGTRKRLFCLLPQRWTGSSTNHQPCVVPSHHRRNKTGFAKHSQRIFSRCDGDGKGIGFQVPNCQRIGAAHVQEAREAEIAGLA